MLYRTKLVILYLSFCVVLTGIEFHIAFVTYTDAKEAVKARLSNDSTLIGEWIRGQINSAEYILADINGHIEDSDLVYPAANQQRYQYINSLLNKKVMTLPGGAFVGILDENCGLMHSNGPVVLSNHGHDFCGKAQRRPLGATVVSDSFISINDLQTFVVAQSFENSDGEFGGLSAIAIDLSFFNSLIEKIEYHPSSLVAIFDRNMVLLGRYPYLPGVIGTVVDQDNAESYLARNKTEPEFIEVESPVDKVHRLYILRKIEGLPFLVVIGERSIIWQSSWRSRMFFMAAALILILLLAYFSGSSMLSVHSQSTQLKNLKEQAERDARVDPLTGLDNRRSFFEIGQSEFKRQARYSSDMCLLTLDLDHFKQVNDKYGHGVGDKALICVSQSIKDTLRTTDYSFRLGGEEFSILLPETNLAQARVFAERLRQRIKQDSENEVGMPQVTASIGLCQALADMKGFQSLVQCADKAMYVAKERGRDQVVAAYEEYS